jgi:hypothetical protein
MLTQEQTNIYEQAIAKAYDKGYAAGAKDMQERCAKICEKLPNGDYNGYGNDGDDYAEAIKALKETK